MTDSQRVWTGMGGGGGANVSCQLTFWPFVSCQLNFGPLICQLSVNWLSIINNRSLLFRFHPNWLKSHIGSHNINEKRIFEHPFSHIMC